MYDTIVVYPSLAYGDLIMALGVIQSVHSHDKLKHLSLKLAVSQARSVIFEAYRQGHGGFISAIVDPGYQPGPREFVIDLRWYQNLLPNIRGVSYLECMFQCAESALQAAWGSTIQLERLLPQLLFPEAIFSAEQAEGRARLERIRASSPGRRILWLGTTTAGSKNRMPQCRAGKEEFWADLVRHIKAASGDEFVFYELRGPKQPPICPGVLPELGATPLSLAAESVIIGASCAGIGVDGMHFHWSLALNKTTMVLVLGPTHPQAVVYPGTETSVRTVPAAAPAGRCFGCGFHGYFQLAVCPQVEAAMRGRCSSFEFDEMTAAAVRANKQQLLDQAIQSVGCRRLAAKETPYDCWDLVEVEPVVTALKELISFSASDGSVIGSPIND